jgi:hypothetical protein
MCSKAALFVLALVASFSQWALAEEPPADQPAGAPEKRTHLSVSGGVDAAFGFGSVVGGRLSPDLTGTLARMPVAAEELTPTVGFQTKGRVSDARVVLTTPLLVGTVEGSRTGIAVGNLTLRDDWRYAFSERFILHATLHASAPTGTREEQPTTSTFNDITSDALLASGAAHVAARAMTGYVEGSTWDSHRWGVGTHIGFEARLERLSLEPYIGSDSRFSLAGRSSPGAFMAGVRGEYRASELTVFSTDVWAIVPDGDLRNDGEVRAPMVFVEPKLAFRTAFLTPTVSVLAPVAGPGDAPRVFALRAGVTTTF